MRSYSRFRMKLRIMRTIFANDNFSLSRDDSTPTTAIPTAVVVAVDVRVAPRHLPIRECTVHRCSAPFLSFSRRLAWFYESGIHSSSSPAISGTPLSHLIHRSNHKTRSPTHTLASHTPRQPRHRHPTLYQLPHRHGSPHERAVPLISTNASQQRDDCHRQPRMCTSIRAPGLPPQRRHPATLISALCHTILRPQPHARRRLRLSTQTNRALYRETWTTKRQPLRPRTCTTSSAPRQRLQRPYRHQLQLQRRQPHRRRTRLLILH